MNKKYTIKFHCYITASSWVDLIDKLAKVKIDVLRVCNSDAKISYNCDPIKDNPFEIEEYKNEHWASFPAKVLNVDKSSVDKLIEFLGNSYFVSKYEAEKYGYYEIIEE